MNAVLITSFDITSQGKTVNETYYIEILSGYVKLCLGKGLNFCPTIGFSTLIALQFTRVGIKIDC
jgi:hypothetical protein